MTVLKYWDATQNQYIVLPGQPGQVYAQVGTTPPAVSAPVVQPPMGLLWVDTGTNPVAWTPPVAYYPPQTPPASGFNSFVDASGTIWVSRNGSAWRKALEALHTRIYLTANAALGGTAQLSLTGVTTDPMGCAASGGFTAPLAGAYLISGSFNLSTAPGAAGNMQAVLTQNGTNVSLGGGMYYPAGNTMWPAVTVTDMIPCAVNDNIQLQAWSTQAITVMGDRARTWLSAQYIGPTT